MDVVVFGGSGSCSTSDGSEIYPMSVYVVFSHISALLTYNFTNELRVMLTYF